METLPGEDIGDELISPFTDPSAAFSIRVASDPQNPAYGEYMQVLNVEE